MATIEVSKGHRQPTKCHPLKYGREKEEKKKGNRKAHTYTTAS
jgi:hypothetical protein